MSPVNARMLRLDWNVITGDEDGYEVEIQLWNGDFAKVATLAKGVNSYVDARGLEPDSSYSYRVRAIRQIGGSSPAVYEASGYSNLATGKTLTIDMGNETCK